MHSYLSPRFYQSKLYKENSRKVSVFLGMHFYQFRLIVHTRLGIYVL